MNLYVLHGLHPRWEPRSVATIHAHTAGSRERAERSRDYYDRFFGGLRDISIVKFRPE